MKFETRLIKKSSCWNRIQISLWESVSLEWYPKSRTQSKRAGKTVVIHIPSNSFLIQPASSVKYKQFTTMPLAEVKFIQSPIQSRCH